MSASWRFSCTSASPAFSGLYKIPRLQIPAQHSDQLGPFTIKQVLIDPNTIKGDQTNPITKLPAMKRPKSGRIQSRPDPGGKSSLQTPPARFARADAARSHPGRRRERPETRAFPSPLADNANLTADISKARARRGQLPDPHPPRAWPRTFLNSSQGTSQLGTPAGRQARAVTGAGNVPGFGDLTPRSIPTCRIFRSRSCCGCPATSFSISIRRS